MKRGKPRPGPIWPWRGDSPVAQGYPICAPEGETTYQGAPKALTP
jgi:hypothetical protein